MPAFINNSLFFLSFLADCNSFFSFNCIFSISCSLFLVSMLLNIWNPTIIVAHTPISPAIIPTNVSVEGEKLKSATEKRIANSDKTKAAAVNESFLSIRKYFSLCYFFNFIATPEITNLPSFLNSMPFKLRIALAPYSLAVSTNLSVIYCFEGIA